MWLSALPPVLYVAWEWEGLIHVAVQGALGTSAGSREGRRGPGLGERASKDQERGKRSEAALFTAALR